ncbi:MAG TPA: PIN domain-containing protein, partial [Candidatus Solibacter sp.]|nr:PIN domain-containing protein [Candidatus Solibacter sp.]
MSRIFWDTNLFIYLLEGSGDLFQHTQRVLSRMAARKDELITSTLTLGEVMAKPLELGQKDIAVRYERFLSSPGVQLVSFDRDAARIFARLRADRTIRPPDAIQLSCAATAAANLFITNDARLSKKI